MIEAANIVEEDFLFEDNTYFLMARAELDDDAGSLSVEFWLKSKNSGEIANVKVTSKITNPLEIVAVYLGHVAQHFGFCIGAKLIHSGGEMLITCYKASEAENAKLPAKKRIRDVYTRLKSKRDDAIKHAKSALKVCAVEAVFGPLIL